MTGLVGVVGQLPAKAACEETTAVGVYQSPYIRLFFLSCVYQAVCLFASAVRVFGHRSMAWTLWISEVKESLPLPEEMTFPKKAIQVSKDLGNTTRRHVFVMGPEGALARRRAPASGLMFWGAEKS